MSLPGGLEEMDNKPPRSRRSGRPIAMFQGLTGGRVIATMDRLSLCCKGIIAENGTEKLSELCDSRQPYEIP